MTTESTAPISVMMLCYNRAYYMRQAIESVLNQTYRDFEFIILDHGSQNKEVYSIAKEYAEQDNRIRLYREETNHGIPWGRNKALEYAKGQYIATIEDDDYWALDKLEKQYAFMCGHPEIMALCCSATTIDEQGNIGKKMALSSEIYSASTDINLLFRSNVLGSGVMFDRVKLVALGGWRDFFKNSDDVDLFHRIQERFNLATTNQSLIFYRIAENASSHHNNPLYVAAATIMSLYRRRNLPEPYDMATQLGVDEFILQYHLKTDYENSEYKTKLTKKIIRYFLIERKYDKLALILSDCCRESTYNFAFRLKIIWMSIKNKRLDYWWYK